MNGIYIQAAACSDKGRVRSNNEDNYYLDGQFMDRDMVNSAALGITEKGMKGVIAANSRDYCQVYAVCDGMGGADSGEEASYCAVRELERYHKGNYEMYVEAELFNIIRGISNRIYREARQRGDKSGTTLAMVSIKGERACIANVGDSRVYRMKGGRLSQVSLDHSEVQRMITMGMITPEEARTHPRRHVINQYMGMANENNVQPKISKDIVLEKGDMYLLCSDGLTDMVTDGEIQSILSEDRPVKELAGLLVQRALQKGGRDNVTVVLLKACEAVKIDDTPKKNKKAGVLQHILTAMQVLIGAALAATIIDLIYLILNS